MPLALRRVLALADKEVRHILRDPRTLYLSLAMPVVMLLLFGFGVSFDLDGIPVAVIDQDRSAQSRALVRRVVANRDFDLVAEAQHPSDADRLLIGGRALAVLTIPAGFEEDLRRGRPAELSLLLDGSDANSATQAKAKMEALAAGIGASLAFGDGGGGTTFIEARTLTRYNPAAVSAIFLVPGIAAYVLAIVAVVSTALTIAREWERGSMAQLFATPVRRLEIVIGKLLPYLVLASVAVLLVIAAGMWVFDVPFRGSPLALAVLSVLFVTGMLGQGLLISVVAKNQMVATQAAAMSSMLPSMLLSGFIFPIQNMPLVLQWITVVIPARYFVSGLRAILLRGNGLGELWPECFALVAFAAVMIALSTARFGRTVA